MSDQINHHTTANHVARATQCEYDLMVAILDVADCLMIVLDRTGRIVCFNQACERTTGYHLDEVRGRYFWDFLLPNADIEPIRAAFDDLAAGQRAGRSENPWLTRDGRLRLISWSNAVLNDANGLPAYIIGTGIDVTEQRRAEQELRASEQCFRTLVTCAPIGIFQADAAGNYTFVNEQWLALTELTDAAGLGAGWVDTIYPDDRAWLMKRWHETVGSGCEFVVEYRVLRPDGTLRWVMGSTIALRDSSGAISGYLGTVKDISDHKRAEIALAQARDAAIESSRLKSEFLATVSHEIRTPLSGVIGMNELLLETALDPEQREFAQAVSDSAFALRTVIDDILDYSKIEAGKLLLHYAGLSLSEVIASVTSILSPQVRAKRLAQVVEISAQVPIYLYGDAGRLRQVLLNLVGNAVKFTAQGGVALRVELYSEDADSVMLCFAVSDTGIGITPAKQQQLFQPFMQADSSVTRTYGGTGLGLAICKRLVELMDGVIGYTSSEGQGSTFWFRLPFRKAGLSVSASDRWSA